jgi:hypothetical protein
MQHHTSRRQRVPFAALAASYFAHIGFFNPLPAAVGQRPGLGPFCHQPVDIAAGDHGAAGEPQPLRPATKKIGTLMAKKQAVMGAPSI